jgi:hypothetical protein
VREKELESWKKLGENERMEKRRWNLLELKGPIAWGKMPMDPADKQIGIGTKRGRQWHTILLVGSLFRKKPMAHHFLE